MLPLGWLSRGAWAAALSLTLFLLAGYALLAMAPRADVTEPIRSVAQILVKWPEDLKPEPQERFVYGGLVLLTPLIIAVVVALVRRTVRLGVGRLDAALSILVLAIGAVILVRDPVSRFFGFTGLWTLAASGAALVLATIDLRWRLPDRPRLLVAFAAFAVAALYTVAISYFDGRTAINPSPNFEAFSYSVVASAKGRACLVDLKAQYGCYGEFYAPILHVMGTSVRAICLISIAAIVVSLGAVTAFGFRTLRSPMLTAGAILAVTICLSPFTYGQADPYFQYAPVRLLWPALSLVGALFWTHRPSRRLATWGPAGDFAFDLTLSVTAQQVPYATLLTDQQGDFHGFTIQAAPEGGFDFIYGVGSHWASAGRFALPPGQRRLTVEKTGGSVRVAVDGATAMEDPVPGYRASVAPVMAGDWANRDRPLRARIQALSYCTR